ncbi:MAG: dUTP diphosphatase [Gammaproteobacteria bacterium]|nr:dUTP diphosphatase [Gammaproteobacteria bacterium]
MERIAKFYKVSLNDETKDFYNDISLPIRATKGSAGYDFKIPYDLTIKAHESAKVYTGVRVKIEEGYVLMIFPRSSLGAKYKLSLDNTVGVIDSDYYYALNEGHIIVFLTNHSDKDLSFKKGDRFAQGVFLPYGITVDDDIKSDRVGGFGSTGK